MPHPVASRAGGTLGAMGIGNRFKILTVRGIPLYVSVSFLVLAGFIVLAILAAGVLADRRGDGARSPLLLEFVLLFGSVLVHEAAHAVVARGFDVPVSGITLTFWGGATETPADSRGPLAEFLIAAAGPFSTLVLAGILFGRRPARWTRDGRARCSSDLAGLNLLLARPQRDPGLSARRRPDARGGRVGHHEAADDVAADRRLGGRRGRPRVHRVRGHPVLGDAGFDLGQLWLGFIGLILFGIGRSMPQRIAVRERLAGTTVGDAMRPPGRSIAANTSLSEALDTHLRSYPDRAFPVVEDGKVVGVVSMTSARRLGGRDPLRPVRDAMRPLNQVVVLSPDTPLEDAWEWLGGRDGLVLRDGSFVGMLGPPDVDAWTRGERHIAIAVPPRPDV